LISKLGVVGVTYQKQTPESEPKNKRKRNLAFDRIFFIFFIIFAGAIKVNICSISLFGRVISSFVNEGIVTFPYYFLIIFCDKTV